MYARTCTGHDTAYIYIHEDPLVVPVNVLAVTVPQLNTSCF